MNQKELGELRRRFRPEKSAISRIYGCYVNGSTREAVSYLDESLGNMPQEEAEKYLSLLKKSLSGTLGRNLTDIVFSTQQVADSDEHRMLSALRESGLKDGEVRQAFYEKVMESLDLEDNNYLILLAHDAYDVPYRSRDGESQSDAGDEVFTCILCCICPVKEGKMELGYFPGENEFHNCAAGQVVSAPELGFLFPAFDGRRANIYNALFYSRNVNEIHQEFVDAIFCTEPPMSPAEQREAFQASLTDGLGEECSMAVAQAIHEQLREKLEQHKESKDPEPLELTAQEIGGILRDCGVGEEKVTAFCETCGERFGGGVLNPANLIDSKKYEIRTAEALVSIDPECSYLVETRVIDGRTYLLIPAGADVEVNGFAVHVKTPEDESAQSV